MRWKQIRRLFSKNYNTRITSIYQEFSNTAVSYSGILCKYVPKFVFFERPIYKRNFILYNSTYKQTAVVYFLESKRSTELFSGRSQESFFPTFNKCFRRNLIITQGVLQKGVMYTIEQKNPCDS